MKTLIAAVAVCTLAVAVNVASATQYYVCGGGEVVLARNDCKDYVAD